MNEIAKRLKELREERDLTMDLLVMDLNEKFDIEIHKSNLSRWEAGLVEPQLRYAVCLAQYFNVSLDYLIGLTDVRTPARLLAYARGLSDIKKDNEQ